METGMDAQHPFADPPGGDPQEPVRPIRALLRGLEALRALNARDGLSVTEVADSARLPRTTAYRILETLRQGGFVVRDEMDDRYRPTLQVRDLAEGAQNEAWIHEGAWPLLSALGKKMLWPLGVWTFDGERAVLRASTDKTSPLALVRLATGATASLAGTPVGHVLLAYAGAHDNVPEAGPALAPRLAAIREAGYLLDPQVVQGETTLVMPIVRADGALAGALSVRFIRSAISDAKAIGELLPLLRDCAAAITRAITTYDRPGRAPRLVEAQEGRI
jgi:IclR family transcriptional regulator, mhp operon transcriptional activator